MTGSDPANRSRSTTLCYAAPRRGRQQEEAWLRGVSPPLARRTREEAPEDNRARNEDVSTAKNGEGNICNTWRPAGDTAPFDLHRPQHMPGDVTTFLRAHLSRPIYPSIDLKISHARQQDQSSRCAVQTTRACFARLGRVYSRFSRRRTTNPPGDKALSAWELPRR